MESVTVSFDTNLKRLNDWDYILQCVKQYYPVYVPIPLLEYDDTDDRSKWTILEKYSTDSRENFIKTSVFKKWCKKYFFEDFDEIRKNILHEGRHCSEEPEENTDYAITVFKDDLIYYPY